MKEFQDLPKDIAGAAITTGAKIVFADCYGHLHRGWVGRVADEWRLGIWPIYVVDTQKTGRNRDPSSIMVVDW